MARSKKHKKEVNMSEEIIEKTNELETLESELDRVRQEKTQLQNEIKELEEKKKLVPRREIDEDEKAIMARMEKRSQNTLGLKAKIEAQKEIDNQKITGRFMNRRAPGQPAKLTYMKYEDDPVKWYTFEDNKVYTIPRGFADQINEHYHTPHFVQRAGEMDPNKPQSAIQEVDTSNKKYAFVATNY